MERIDLHIHTVVSDGTFTPEEVVRRAVALGLSGIAITDHDAVAGCDEAVKLGRELGIEVVPGIEISTKYKRAVHILGYYIDTASPALHEVLDWIVIDRDTRAEKMTALMAADGLDVNMEDMHRRYGEIIGRPHFARRLMELGLAESVDEAFDRYVQKGKKYYVGRSFLSMEKSIQLIIEAGGIPVLAHPYQSALTEEELTELIEYSKDCGIQGMECRYSGYSAEREEHLEELAEKYGLIKTGGSDFHGANKPAIQIGSGMGSLNVPKSFLDELKRRHAEN